MDGDAVREIIQTAQSAVEHKPQLCEGPGFKKLAIPSMSAEGAVNWTLDDLPCHEVTAPPLVVHTLSGLVNYIVDNRDSLELEKSTVHIVGPDRIDYFSELSGELPARTTWVRAEWGAMFQENGTSEYYLRSGRWVDPETFVIGMQIHFAESDDRAKVLAVVGNVRAEGVTTWDDDGVSQAVQAGTGVKLGKLVGLPNPIWLRPWRTFREVGQPASRYVLRARGNAQSVPQLALFEADGGRWRIEAIEAIAAYLRERVPPTVSVIA